MATLNWSTGLVALDGYVIDYLHGDTRYWRFRHSRSVVYALKTKWNGRPELIAEWRRDTLWRNTPPGSLPFWRRRFREVLDMIAHPKCSPPPVEEYDERTLRHFAMGARGNEAEEVRLKITRDWSDFNHPGTSMAEIAAMIDHLVARFLHDFFELSGEDYYLFTRAGKAVLRRYAERHPRRGWDAHRCRVVKGVDHCMCSLCRFLYWRKEQMVIPAITCRRIYALGER